MTTTYIGYMSSPPDIPTYAILRDTGAFPRALAEKMRAFPGSLPSTCKLIGSWAVFGPAPNVVIVETESVADLQHIDNHYLGWVIFDWHPCIPMPRDL
ncbi:MAG: hypothetical protein R3B97_05070 [Dehalococcoidia bacterium]|nr:hypothetical protein [Dehalococcoidia bacterium]MCA9829164.1 hypothetical protein [Dehalococcoidia bacterium]